jgi:DNA replication and repair protein RecF
VYYLSKLKLTNFRNYNFAEADFAPLINVITGSNGAGKTSLLEAISLLTPGKGMRGAALTEMLRSGKESWNVFAEVGGYKIGTALEAGSPRRIVKIDGELQKGVNSLANHVSAVWLTPQMDGVFLADSGERRRFFDRIIYNFDPEHASRVAVYENAMRERLRLLKDGTRDNHWLTALEKRMAEYGTAVAAARIEVIGFLQSAINSRLSLFPKAEIEVKGKYETLIKSRSALEVENIFLEDLLSARSLDANQGRTSAGVHRTDFAVTNIAKNIAAEHSSTGEQKALLLSIILALANMLRIRKDRAPILLLDEVVAHLDEARREELFAEIRSTNSQTFITGTENTLFQRLEAAHFLVEEGVVKTS